MKFIGLPIGGIVLVLLVAACGRPEAPQTTTGPGILTEAEFNQRFPKEIGSPLRALVERQAVECSPKPTQDEINTTEGMYQDLYMSAKRAANLGIPIVNASGKSDYLVIVRDYRRFKPCTATDGKTVLHYGQVIRAVIELTDYQAEVKLALAALAASATLNGKQQYFYLYRSGWFSPKADAVLASISGKVFDVENYALYQSVMPQLIGLMSDSTTTLGATVIFRVPAADDPTFLMASARAYAFSQAKDGKSCQSASQRFAKDAGRAAAVVDAYTFLGKPNCTNDPVVEPEKSRAVGLLGGLSVR